MTSSFLSSIGGLLNYRSFLQHHLKPLDDVFGIDSWLRNTWAYSLSEYGSTLSTIVFPFFSLIIVYALGCGFMFFLEYGPIGKYLESFKIQKKHNNATLNWRCVKQLLVLYFVIILPLYAGAFSFLTSFGFSVEPELLPPWYIILFQLFICLIFEDFFHYWLHRALHTEFLYRTIHSVHHEFTAPSSMATTYSHPIEVIVLGLATFSGPFVLRPHVVVLYFWVNLRQFAAMETHCGYEFPFSPNKWIPLVGGAEFHDFHHRTFNGAYASNFLFWDWLFGTDKGYLRMQEKKKKRNA